MPVEQLHVPGVADDRVILEGLQPPLGLHALGDAPIEGGVGLALREVGAEAEPARTHEAVVDRKSNKAVGGEPLLVQAVDDIPHHARTIVDLGVRAAGAPAIAVHGDVKVLATALLPNPVRLVARVGDSAANGAMVALEDAAVHARRVS